MIKVEVSEGKLPWIVGTGTVLFGILLIILSMMYPGGSETVMKFSYFVFFLIIVSGIRMCLVGRNWKLSVEDESLCYTDWLGRKKDFALNEIARCQAALEIKRGSKNYLKLYDSQDVLLCKLDFNMMHIFLFMQYLLDNHVKIECSETSDILLKEVISIVEISPEEIADKVNSVYNDAVKMVREWSEKNKNFGAEWKLGIATYNESDNLQAGFFIMLEAYLQKDGRFVFDNKNRPVAISTELLFVDKALRKDNELKVCFHTGALEKLSDYLSYYENILPKNRYHMDELTLDHELKERYLEK
ncbi:MAG: hypothetical protein J1D87_02005 [Lachnospiraceae bacterium]|nr:hypothetical protein [Lachnospiraceae bacterium]